MKIIIPIVILVALSFHAKCQIQAEVLDRGTTLGSTGDLTRSDHASITKYSKGFYVLSCLEYTDNILNSKHYEVRIKNKITLDDFYSLMMQVVNQKKDFKFSINAGETIFLEWFPLGDYVQLTASRTPDKLKPLISVRFQKYQIDELFGKTSKTK